MVSFLLDMSDQEAGHKDKNFLEIPQRHLSWFTSLYTQSRDALFLTTEMVYLKYSTPLCSSFFSSTVNDLEFSMFYDGVK